MTNLLPEAKKKKFLAFEHLVTNTSCARGKKKIRRTNFHNFSMSNLQLKTHQVLVWSVFIIKHRSDFSELCQDIIVSRHVCGQDTSDNSLTYFPVEMEQNCYWLVFKLVKADELLVHVFGDAFKKIAVGIFQQSKGDWTVMIFQRRNVIVSRRKTYFVSDSSHTE